MKQKHIMYCFVIQSPTSCFLSYRITITLHRMFDISYYHWFVNKCPRITGRVYESKFEMGSGQLNSSRMQLKNILLRQSTGNQIVKEEPVVSSEGKLQDQNGWLVGILNGVDFFLLY